LTQQFATEDFSTWSKGVLQHVEVTLDRLLPAAAVAGAGGTLNEAMRYAMLGGGKRIRPLLAVAAAELAGGTHESREVSELTMRAAVAVEMIHAYSLAHDDMPCMDNDALRRGKPTVHVRYGEATALLAGDALQAEAFSVLAEAAPTADAPERAASVVYMLRVLARASGAHGMCGGQAIDLASVGRSLGQESLEQMHRMKTGALLHAAVLLGAASAKIPDATVEAALLRYSRAIGLAFQVVDDVLDATADTATLGKTAGKDQADGKPTFVSMLGLDASRRFALELREQAHAALVPYGVGALRLRELADLIVVRGA